MDVVDPVHLFGLLDDWDIEVDDHGLLAAAAEHAGERLRVARVDFLVRHVGRDVDEVAGTGFGDELQLVAPAHARLAAHDVDDAFDGAVMVGAGLCLWMDDHGAGPELLRTHARMGDGGCPVHPWRLGGVDVELVGVHHSHAVEFPFRIRGGCHGVSSGHYAIGEGRLPNAGPLRRAVNAPAGARVYGKHLNFHWRSFMKRALIAIAVSLAFGTAFAQTAPAQKAP